MVRLLVRQALRFALGLVGSVLAAALLAALSVEGATSGVLAYAVAVGGRLAAMARLDFGLSHVSGWSAAGELAHTLPFTASLVLLGALVAVAIGAPLGLVLGTGPLRRAAAPLIQIVAAAPVFCAALLLSWLAVRLLHVSPAVMSQAADSNGFVPLLLAVITVGLAGAAAIQLALRRSASEAQGQPWRTSLRLMGLSALDIERLYVAPEIFAGLLSQLGDVVLALLSAAAVAEWVFGWPGAAAMFVKSLALGDWNVVALVLLAFIAIKLAADLIGALGARAVHGGRT